MPRALAAFRREVRAVAALSHGNIVSVVDHDLIPQHAILQQKIKYVPADRQNGAFYAVPCVLRQSQGVTYLG